MSDSDQVIIGTPLSPPDYNLAPGQTNGGISPGGSVSFQTNVERSQMAAKIKDMIIKALKDAGVPNYDTRATNVMNKLRGSPYSIMFDGYKRSTISVVVGTAPEGEAAVTTYRAYEGQTHDSRYPITITLDMTKITVFDSQRPLFFEMVIVHELLHPLSTNRHLTEVDKASYARQVQHIGSTMGYPPEIVATWY